ncbi:hypothetical protein FRC00_002496 [Tulasnella sp. 408]|nr:hypothetical protein FRC00_002496 [Tulasnella sp. 408]
MTPSSFMEKVGPHIGRWRVVELCDTAWAYLPQAPAPQLRDLSATVYPRVHRGSAPRVLRAEFTSLRRLALHIVYLSGPLPDFGRNLRFLTIRQSGQKDTGITWIGICRLLLLNSNLVEVKLQGLRQFEVTPNPEMLEELAVSDLPEGYSGLLRAVEPYFASVITAVSRDLKLFLSFTRGFTFAIGRGDKTFKLTTWNPKPDAELRWVVDLLVRYRPNVSDLEVVTPRALSDDVLSNLFMALPAVTQFRSDGGLEAAWNVLGKFKPAAPGVEGGPAQWLLPALEKLTVLDKSDKEGERFIAMIQAREAAATDTDSTRSLAEHHPRYRTW